MNYVIGNPPYIRIHDLKLDYRKYSFTSEGMSDLYLIFFELSIKMLNATGEIIYITPNSFFTSNAAKKFREYLVENNLLKKIINLGHFNPFKGITTYPAITLISKQNISEEINKISYSELIEVETITTYKKESGTEKRKVLKDKKSFIKITNKTKNSDTSITEYKKEFMGFLNKNYDLKNSILTLSGDGAG
jgi:type II restriction/modification system DNA methylase subunit YeeA